MNRNAASKYNMTITLRAAAPAAGGPGPHAYGGSQDRSPGSYPDTVSGTQVPSGWLMSRTNPGPVSLSSAPGTGRLSVRTTATVTRSPLATRTASGTFVNDAPSSRP